MVPLETNGVNVSHVKVSASIVYRADKNSNYRFSNGVDSFSPEEIEEIEKCDRQIVKDEGMDLLFEEYYEVKYKDAVKKYSVNDFLAIVSLFNDNEIDIQELLLNH